jgi:cAMP-dependent protein kinase regulator
MADSNLKVVNFGPGQTLMKQGDHGNMAWLLQDGEVEVYTDTDTGRKSLARLRGKQVVGEMALIDNGLRTATVVVREPVTATEIPRDAFTRMFNSCEPLARHVLSHLVNAVRASRGIAVTEAAISGPTIRSSEDSGRILERRVFGAGTFIFRENDPAEAAYLIQTGSVNIVQGGTKIIATLLPGRTFGEMALLRNARRMASAIVGEGGAAVEIIRRREFEKAISTMPKILQSLTQAYLGYLLNPE